MTSYQQIREKGKEVAEKVGKWVGRASEATLASENANGSRIPLGVETKRYLSGEEATSDEFQPGDFILVHGAGFFEGLIRIGQRLWFWGEDKVYAYWHHAAVIISEDGELIEAKAGKNRVTRSHLSKYGDRDYKLVRIDGSATPADRAQIVKFAEWCEGQKYGYFTIFSIFICLLTGLRFSFMFEGQHICSGLVARALERTSLIFNRSPSHLMPADLAKMFDVRP